jgi:hypothetical protein
MAGVVVMRNDDNPGLAQEIDLVLDEHHLVVMLPAQVVVGSEQSLFGQVSHDRGGRCVVRHATAEQDPGVDVDDEPFVPR